MEMKNMFINGSDYLSYFEIQNFIVMDKISNNNERQSVYFEDQVLEKKYKASQSDRLSMLCLQYFQKYFCTQFAPFSQFFSLNNCAQVVPSKPSFQPTLSKSLRDNLKVDRQIQYLKGSIKQPHIYTTIQQELNSQIRYQPINRKGNLLIDYKDKLYWCFQTKLKYLQLGQSVKNQNFAEKGSRVQKTTKKNSWFVSTQQQKDLLDIDEMIYQLKIVKNILIIRAARKIFFYDLNQYKIVHSISFKNEILTVWLDSENWEILYISLTDGFQSQIQKINISNSNVENMINQSLIHTAWNLHRNWAVACCYNSIMSLDFRVKKANKFRRVQQNYRIFGGVSLKSKVFTQNFCVTSESFQAKVFDIRKPENELTNFRHFCEQAPPTILSIYEAEKEISPYDQKNRLLISKVKQNSENKNILILATNPYVFGSSLMTQLSQQFLPGKHFYKEKKINTFELSFDKGKIQKNYHPLSSHLIHFQNQKAIFHLDNRGGISVQLYQKQKTIKKESQQIGYKLRRLQFNKDCGIQQIQSLNQEWLLNKRLSIYLKTENQNRWEKRFQEDSMDLELIEDTFKEKYLRYTDLNKFHSQLELQKQENLLSKLRQEQKDFDIFKIQKENSDAFATFQSTCGEVKQTNIIKSLFSSDLLQYLSKDWEKSQSKF